MGRIKYTITTYTKRCPSCGEILEEETKGTLTPLLGVAWVLGFPIMLSYTLLKYLAFSNPSLKPVGKKYRRCPNCTQIVKTDNCYMEELYGKDLLDQKIYPLFFLAYLLGSIFFCALLSFIDGSSDIKIAISVVSFFILLCLIIVYRIQLTKYSKKTGISHEAAVLIKAKEKREFQAINKASYGAPYEDLYPRECEYDSFVKDYEQRIVQHKKWLSNEKEGIQLVVKNEIITNIRLQGTGLQNSIFRGCTFKDLDLSNIRFRRSDLSHSKFINCTLTKTDFSGANLDGVKFTNCNKDEAIF